MNAFPTRVLLATDGSEDAHLAVRAAIDLSQKGGSELHVVHVWHDVPTPHAHSFITGSLLSMDIEVEPLAHKHPLKQPSQFLGRGLL